MRRRAGRLRGRKRVAALVVLQPVEEADALAVGRKASRLEFIQVVVDAANKVAAVRRLYVYMLRPQAGSGGKLVVVTTMMMMM